MTVPYQTYTRDQWKQILPNAVHAHDLNAVRDATEALNRYGQESLDATRLSSIPQEIGAVLGGAQKGIIGIPGGLKALAGQLGQGDIGGAAQSFLGGIEGVGKGIANAVEVGSDALSQWGPDAEYMPESERLQKLESAGSTLPALGLARVGEPVVKGAIKGAVNAGLSPIGGMLGKIARSLKAPGEAGAAEAEAAQAGASGVSPAGATPSAAPDALRGLSDEQLAAQSPLGKTPPVEQSGLAPGAMDRRISSSVGKMLGRRATDVNPSGLIGTGPESITPEALAKTQWIGTPNVKASLEEIINRNAEVNKPSDTGTLSNQPEFPPFEESEMLPGMKKFTKPSQKAMTFGKESPLSATSKASVKELLGQIAQSLSNVQ